MELPKLRRQSEDAVSLDEDYPGGLSRLTSTNTAGEEVNHLHHCSPCSRVGEGSFSMEELEFSEQDSSAAMDSVRSAFSTFEARKSFSKLRQELVHRHRMIEAVSRRHRRALTGKAQQGAREGALVPAPCSNRAEAVKATKTSPRQRDVSGSPKRTELKEFRPRQERLKGWKKRNLPRSKADTSDKRKVSTAQYPSPRKAVEMREMALRVPTPSEDRWESVKQSATFSRLNLEAIMVQRSWRKQMIRSLQQPMVEVKDFYDLLNDPQSWRQLSSSPSRCPIQGWATDEQTEAVALPRSSNASPAPPHHLHRPARCIERPIKRSERPATVGASTFQLPLDLEETVWNVVDLSS